MSESVLVCVCECVVMEGDLSPVRGRGGGAVYNNERGSSPEWLCRVMKGDLVMRDVYSNGKGSSPEGVLCIIMEGDLVLGECCV